MKDLYARLEEDFRLRGLSARSRTAYLGAVRQLERHCGRSPDELGDEEVRGYFLHLIDVRRVAPSTVHQQLYAIKFLYRVTLKRELPCLATIRPKRRQKLPVVLSVEEVRRVLKQLRVEKIRSCTMVIYSCGLRLTEATHLQVADIDSDRMLLRVEAGKGDKVVKLWDIALRWHRKVKAEADPYMPEHALYFLRRRHDPAARMYGLTRRRNARAETAPR